MRRVLVFALLLLVPIAAGAREPPKHKVLIELFTAQGDPNCLTAEDFLERLVGTEHMEFIAVVAWHVNHRDRLGWKDTFADPAFTDRQKAVLARIGTGRLTTPLLLVNGAPYAPGWEAGVREAASGPAAVAIDADVALDGADLTVRVRLSESRGDLPAGAVVRPLLVQHRASTAVTSGENCDKTVVQHFVVRRAMDPAPAADALAAPVERKTTLPDGLGPDDFSLVVLVEDQTTFATVEAATFPLTRPPPGLLLVVDSDSTRAGKIRTAIAEAAEANGFAVATVAQVPANDRALEQALKRIAKSQPFDERHVVVLGFSNAAKQAYAFAVKHRARTAGLVIAAGVLTLSAEDVAAAKGLPVFLAWGQGDATAKPEDGLALRDALAKAGAEVDWALVDAVEHFAVLPEGSGPFLRWAAKRYTAVR